MLKILLLDYIHLSLLFEHLFLLYSFYLLLNFLKFVALLTCFVNCCHLAYGSTMISYSLCDTFLLIGEGHNLVKKIFFFDFFIDLSLHLEFVPVVEHCPDLPHFVPLSNFFHALVYFVNVWSMISFPWHLYYFLAVLRTVALRVFFIPLIYFISFFLIVRVFTITFNGGGQI